MPKEVWISPHGHFQITRHIPEEGYENETREEWAEPLDLSVFQRKDTRTPEERAEWRKKAVAEIRAYRKAEGLELNEEQQADMEPSQNTWDGAAPTASPFHSEGRQAPLARMLKGAPGGNRARRGPSSSPR